MSEMIATDRQLEPMPQRVAKGLETRFKRFMNKDYTHSPIEFIEELYKMIDIAAKNVQKQSVCTRGCSHCCYVNVDATSIEAGYIGYKYGHELTNTEDEPLIDTTGDKCRFLIDNECSIYEARPAACRSFFTLDSPDFCADDTFPSHEVIGIVFNEDDGNTNPMSTIYFQAIKRVKALKVKRLVQWFD